MSACLKEEQLVAFYYGDGSSEQASHLEACETCRHSYDRLEAELTLIGEALAEPAPPAIEVGESGTAWTPPRWSWLAATAAVIVMISINVARISEPIGPVRVASVDAGEFDASLERVGSAIFGSDVSGDDEASDGAVEFAYVQAALDGDFPYFWADPFYSEEYEPALMDFSDLSMGG